MPDAAEPGAEAPGQVMAPAEGEEPPQEIWGNVIGLFPAKTEIIRAREIGKFGWRPRCIRRCCQCPGRSRCHCGAERGVQANGCGRASRPCLDCGKCASGSP
eukprot:8226669-Pyramimonas_sp.AAC.1